MACEFWKAHLDTYVDGELPVDQRHDFETHLRTCLSCSGAILFRVQMKRAVQVAGKRYTAGAEFRRRLQRNIAAKQPHRLRSRWTLAAVVLATSIVAGVTSFYLERVRLHTDSVYSEIADLHVSTLASSSPVDVISSDRHTVKPWFQGRIPFTFNLPELQTSEFSLVGGRVTYLDQAPGAQLIYQVRNHRISVFVFSEDSLRGKFSPDSGTGRTLSFNSDTWSQGGLRYFVIGDASASDIHSLSNLLKSAGV
jgi:anti-sigma factor RsiW